MTYLYITSSESVLRIQRKELVKWYHHAYGLANEAEAEKELLAFSLQQSLKNIGKLVLTLKRGALLPISKGSVEKLDSLLSLPEREYYLINPKLKERISKQVPAERHRINSST